VDAGRTVVQIKAMPREQFCSSLPPGLMREIYLRLGIGIELAHGPDVRFGSEAGISRCNRHVRFTPESGHLQCISRCPLRANSGHLCAYSINSSARASNGRGIVRPSALAVLRLMISSNFAAWSIGKSAG
jgi:hypothetical protein